MPGLMQPERELTWSEDGRLIHARVKSLFTGQWNEMNCHPLDERAITHAQWDAWQAGEYIQRAMPQLTAEEREFLMSGATPDEWDCVMEELDDEEDGSPQ